MDELGKLSKLPPWAWGVAVLGGLGLFWWSRRTTSTVPAPVDQGTASSVAGQQANQGSAGSMNLATPQCYQYSLPFCSDTQTLVWGLDGQGCPIPVCQNKPASVPQVTTSHLPIFVTSLAGQDIYQLEAEGQILAPTYWWGATGIQTRNANLAGYTLTAPLPAGLRVQVAG